MKTYQARWISLVLVLLLNLSCAMPPSSTLAKGSTSSNSSGGSGYSTSAGSYTLNYPGGSGTSSSATTTSASPTPSTPAVSCTFPTPTLVNTGGYYYVKASINLTSSVQISYVQYSLSTGGMSYGTPFYSVSAPPYQITYLLGVAGYYQSGQQTLTATAVDINGVTYPSICSSSFLIN